MSDLNPTEIFSRYQRNELDKITAVNYLKTFAEKCSEELLRVEAVGYLGKMNLKADEIFKFLDYHVTWSKTNLINPYLKFKIEHDYYITLFPNFPASTHKAQSDIINMVPFLREFPVDNKIIAKSQEVQELFLSHILKVAEDILTHKGSAKDLPIYNGVLKILNSYKDNLIKFLPCILIYRQ